MNKNITIIEERIIDLRIESNYNQGDIAKIMNVSSSLISMWERGYANISLKQIIKFCSIYQVSLDYILGLTNIKNNPNYKYNYINKLDLKYLGLKIKEIRKKARLSQQEFALKIHTKRSSISYYEIGKMMISTADLKEICLKFNCSSDYLIGNISENYNLQLN